MVGLPTALQLVHVLLSTTETHTCTHLTRSRIPVVGLSGTRSARDLLDDVDVRTTTWPPELRSDEVYEDGSTGSGNEEDAAMATAVRAVHRGFARRTLRIWKSNAELRRFCLRDAANGTLVLTGWSLGGGVAVCLASMLHECYDVKVRKVCVFGSPRAGNVAFADWYEAEELGDVTVRYEVPCDPVAQALERRFVHVGRRVEVPCNEADTSLLAQHDLRLYLASLEEDDQ